MYSMADREEVRILSNLNEHRDNVTHHSITIGQPQIEIQETKSITQKIFIKKSEVDSQTSYI